MVWLWAGVVVIMCGVVVGWCGSHVNNLTAPFYTSNYCIVITGL